MPQSRPLLFVAILALATALPAAALPAAPLPVAPFASPPPPPDRVERVQFEAVTATADAPPVEGRLELRFGGRRLSRTVVRCLLAIGSSFASRNQHGYYNLRLSGEVLHEQGAVDRFDYRFDIPTVAQDPSPLALEFDRDLRPGHYRLALELEDLFTGRSFTSEDELEVPSPEAPRSPIVLPVELAGAQVGAPAGDTAPAAVELVVPDEPVLVGHQRVGARVSAEVAAGGVRFLLDGRPVVEKRRPPYSAELDFGDDRGAHRLRVEALGGDGAVAASDERLINTGRERFDVALVEPRDGAPTGEAITARARCVVPAGSRVEALDYYLGEHRVASVAGPDCDRAVVLPPVTGTTAVRVVARLEDGRSAEATALIDASAFVDRVDVRLVELYASVVNRWGRSVGGLGPADFAVRENGRPQKLTQAERVSGLPLHVALVVDVSRSMQAAIGDVSRSAIDFLHETLGPADRAEIVTFDTFPRLAVGFSNDFDRLANALTGLRAGGKTALHDGVMLALRQLDGVAGQRVVVLFSDGETTMRRDPATLVEFARRSGVTLYTIGMNLPSDDIEGRRLLARLANETGGRSFLLDAPRSLALAYRTIEREMRSRYLLTYQSNQPEGDAFRELVVEVDRPGTEVRTVSGYYP